MRRKGEEEEEDEEEKEEDEEEEAREKEDEEKEEEETAEVGERGLEEGAAPDEVARVCEVTGELVLPVFPASIPLGWVWGLLESGPLTQGSGDLRRGIKQGSCWL